ncbi:MAG: hypothetical protein KDA92_04605, partial [Planctomycetales bacterium]|nr:hypothetical protein [Planctomycetales bacterium]
MQNLKLRRTQKPKRAGNIVVLTVMLMIGMIAMLAFSLDLGYIYTVRTEIQRSADAAALAAACQLLDDQIETMGDISQQSAASNARTEAVRFAGYNTIGRVNPQLGQSDVVVGRYDLDDSGASLDPSSADAHNAVSVRVQRTLAQNGEVRLFFARVLGRDSLGLECESMAAFKMGFKGFTTPSDGSNLDILPIAFDVGSWNTLICNAGGNDDWSWDPEDQTITPGPDGCLEINLYPQGTGSPGNRGTVDIGSSNNSTNDLKRQITDGISPSDLEHHGGKLELTSCNGSDPSLSLNADTGISAAIKAQLDEIKGEPRVIPIFSQISGNGNNANYTITGFVGIRIMEVKLTGAMNQKRV